MTAPTSDRAGIVQTFEALKKAGWTDPSVWDGEEDTPVTTAKEAADIVMNLDQARLYVKGPLGSEGWVFFVLGNDPDEVICDHTVNLSEVLDPLTQGWFE